MTVQTHVVLLESSETKGEFLWVCSCGQSSGPWPKHIAKQQGNAHLKEWSQYQNMMTELDNDKIVPKVEDWHGS